MKKQSRSHCPIGLGLDIFGDRWSLMILRDVFLWNKTHYQEFLLSPENIATNVLAERLARLMEEGILTKAADPDNGKQFIYLPTKKGLDLLPLLSEMIRWGLDHIPEARTNKVIDRMLANEQQFREGIVRQFSQVGVSLTKRKIPG